MSGYNKPEVFIKNITFNDGNTFNFNEFDIVVFTGANNVGKSQVLRDIEQHIQSGNDKTTPVINNIDSDFKGDIELFLENTKQNKDGSYWTGTSFQHASNVYFGLIVPLFSVKFNDSQLFSIAFLINKVCFFVCGNLQIGNCLFGKQKDEYLYGANIDKKGTKK